MLTLSPNEVQKIVKDYTGKDSIIEIFMFNQTLNDSGFYIPRNDNVLYLAPYYANGNGGTVYFRLFGDEVLKKGGQLTQSREFPLMFNELEFKGHNKTKNVQFIGYKITLLN